MIQILRGTSAQRASHSEVSTDGQPIYETDTSELPMTFSHRLPLNSSPD